MTRLRLPARAAAACLLAGVSAAPAAALAPGRSETVLASFYGAELHGRPKANGERFDMRALTAAHRTLPFGTRLRVTNPANGRSVVVRITDRGPFTRGRGLDVSYAAARELGFVRAGTARLRVERL